MGSSPGNWAVKAPAVAIRNVAEYTFRPYAMPEQMTPRGKRLLIIAMVVPWLFLAVYYGAPLLNSQTRHMKAVDAHIEKITPQWKRFCAEHPGFDQVTLFAYTDGDGMFGAHGHVATDEQVVELRKFMESTTPPRPVYVGAVQVAGPEFFELQKKEAEQLPNSKRQ